MPSPYGALADQVSHKQPTAPIVIGGRGKLFRFTDLMAIEKQAGDPQSESEGSPRMRNDLYYEPEDDSHQQGKLCNA